MNNMTMSALRSFGWSSDPPLPGPEVGTRPGSGSVQIINLIKMGLDFELEF